jgi:bifunctional non-homologous end joining protein LigD
MRGSLEHESSLEYGGSVEEQVLQIEGLRISHPKKILFPEQGITKAAIAEYYKKVAPFMLPELRGRLVTLVRCPAGKSQKCFFQKHPDEAMAEELKSVRVKEQGGEDNYSLIDDTRDLIYLVQMNVLEIHCWGSRAPKIELPDRMIFDLDPDPSVPSVKVVDAAKTMRAILKELKLESFVKTTGGKGLHVVVPLKQKHSWDEVKAASHFLAETLASTDPNQFISVMSKAKRKGRIFVDYLRNGRGATSIANFSTRARSSAPIAVPLAWKELTPSLTFNAWTTSNIFRRLNGRYKNPWEEIDDVKQSLPAELLKASARYL